MPRQARLDSPATLHHVIVRGIEKWNIVNDKYDRGNVVLRLRNLAEETKTNVYAWVLMSNRMHILLDKPCRRGGSRRDALPRLREQLAKELVENLALPWPKRSGN